MEAIRHDRYVDIFENLAGGDAANAVRKFDEIVSLLTGMFASQGIGESERSGELFGFDKETRAIGDPRICCFHRSRVSALFFFEIFVVVASRSPWISDFAQPISATCQVQLIFVEGRVRLYERGTAIVNSVFLVHLRKMATQSTSFRRAMKVGMEAWRQAALKADIRLPTNTATSRCESRAADCPQRVHRKRTIATAIRGGVHGQRSCARIARAIFLIRKKAHPTRRVHELDGACDSLFHFFFYGLLQFFDFLPAYLPE